MVACSRWLLDLWSIFASYILENKAAWKNIRGHQSCNGYIMFTEKLYLFVAGWVQCNPCDVYGEDQDPPTTCPAQWHLSGVWDWWGKKLLVDYKSWKVAKAIIVHLLPIPTETVLSLKNWFDLTLGGGGGGNWILIGEVIEIFMWYSQKKCNGS